MIAAIITIACLILGFYSGFCAGLLFGHTTPPRKWKGKIK